MQGEARLPAPFWPRAAAWLMDRAILFALFLLPRSLCFFYRLAAGTAAAPVFFRFTAADIFFWALTAVYFTAFTFLSGATPGKRAMGLEVLRTDGGRLSFLTCLYRETVGRYLSSILLIGYLMAAVDPRKRALHDRICDTQVVYTQRRALPAAPARPLSVYETDDPRRDWYKPYRM